jgi:hypothetical protein
VVLPEVRRHVAFEFLDLSVSGEDGDELGRQGNRLAAAFLNLAEDQAASLPLGAHGGVRGAAGRAQPGRTVPRGAGSGEAVSPDGRTLFVAGVLRGHFETIAYGAATGARVWARGYQPAGSSCACFPPYIAVSPDGARVYVTGRTLSTSGLNEGAATLAYDARTGRQLWVRRYLPQTAYGGLAVSPDGTTLYELGARRVSGGRWRPAVIAYAAATGKRRWLRAYPRYPGLLTSIAVSPDGNTVYATGSADATGSGGHTSSVLAVAYGAAGTLKWTAGTTTRIRAEPPAIRSWPHPAGPPSTSSARVRTSTGTSTPQRSPMMRPPASSCGWTDTPPTTEAARSP